MEGETHKGHDKVNLDSAWLTSELFGFFSFLVWDLQTEGKKLNYVRHLKHASG